jgi:hypothetical protein
MPIWKPESTTCGAQTDRGDTERELDMVLDTAYLEVKHEIIL